MRLRIVHLRAIMSTVLSALLVITFITSTVLFFAPSGQDAASSDWTFLGADRSTMNGVHTSIGFAFMALMVIHLIINNKMLRCEMVAFAKKRRGKGDSCEK